MPKISGLKKFSFLNLYISSLLRESWHLVNTCIAVLLSIFILPLFRCLKLLTVNDESESFREMGSYAGIPAWLKK